MIVGVILLHSRHEDPNRPNKWKNPALGVIRNNWLSQEPCVRDELEFIYP